MVNSTPGYSDPYYAQNVTPPSSGAPADQSTQQFLADLEKEINALEALEKTVPPPNPLNKETADLISTLKTIENTVKNGGSLSEVKASFESAVKQ